MKITRVETFQVDWSGTDQLGRQDHVAASRRHPHSAFVRIETDEGVFGLGEASPMQGGLASLVIMAQDMAPALIGADPLDHAVLIDTLLHTCIKLGPEGATTSALAALDIALWDLKGKILNQPVYKLLGGAWRTQMPCYASVGRNAFRSVDEMLAVVERRVEVEQPAAVKIRRDGNRTIQDEDIPGDIRKAAAVRKLLGDDFVLGFDASNAYSVGGAMRVGRALEDLGYDWFEEPVQHYHVATMGEVAQRLDITVSAGEQTYTLQGLKDLINAGVRMVQPDVIKMGGMTGLMQCAAIAQAHGVELVPHQTQPTIGHLANLHVLSTIMHLSKPAELADGWERASAVFRDNPAEPKSGLFTLPTTPGLGMNLDEEALRRRSLPVRV